MMSGRLRNGPLSPGLFARYGHIIHHKKAQNFLYLIIYLKISLDNNYAMKIIKTNFFTYMF